MKNKGIEIVQVLFYLAIFLLIVVGFTYKNLKDKVKNSPADSTSKYEQGR